MLNHMYPRLSFSWPNLPIPEAIPTVPYSCQRAVRVGRDSSRHTAWATPRTVEVRKWHLVWHKGWIGLVLVILGREKGLPEGWCYTWLHLYKTFPMSVTFKVLFAYVAKTNELKEVPAFVATSVLLSNVLQSLRPLSRLKVQDIWSHLCSGMP